MITLTHTFHYDLYSPAGLSFAAVISLSCCFQTPLEANAAKFRHRHSSPHRLLPRRKLIADKLIYVLFQKTVPQINNSRASLSPRLQREQYDRLELNVSNSIIIQKKSTQNGRECSSKDVNPGSARQRRCDCSGVPGADNHDRLLFDRNDRRKICRLTGVYRRNDMYETQLKRLRSSSGIP